MNELDRSTVQTPKVVRAPPEPIYEFRNAVPEDQFNIPELVEKRHCTDVFFLILMIVMVLGLIVCLCTILPSSKLKMFTNGYDKCGNICGMENEIIPGINCSGGNMANKPFIQLVGDKSGKSVRKECVKECSSPAILYFNRCYFFEAQFSHQYNYIYNRICDGIKEFFNYIFAICIFGFATSAICAFLFKFKSYLMLWLLYYLGLILQLFLAAFLLFKCLTTSQRELFLLYLLWTIFIVLYFLINIYILILNRKTFLLIFRLIDEAISIIVYVPFSLLYSFLTFLFKIIFLIAFVIINILLSTCKQLEPVPNELDRYEFRLTAFTAICFAYNTIVFLWLFTFVTGCEHMVLAGAFAPFYFTRDRSTVKNALGRSYFVLWRFHLGTVAVGSLVINIAILVKYAIQQLVKIKLSKNSCLAICIQCILNVFVLCLEEVLEYLTKYAYIETALHGSSFWKSGVRAVRLLWTNLLISLNINYLSDFILYNITLTLTFLATGFGILIGINIDLEYYWVAVVIGTLITSIICFSICNVLEAAIGTIFLSFCEDRMLNDGVLRPYFTNQKILDLIDEAQKLNLLRKGKGCCPI